MYQGTDQCRPIHEPIHVKVIHKTILSKTAATFSVTSMALLISFIYIYHITDESL